VNHSMKIIIQLLGSLGPEAGASLPLIQELASKDPDAGIRSLAKYTLRKLGAYSFHNKDDGDGAGEANLELRFGKKYFFVGPLIGGLANTDGAFYGYAGFYSDLSYRKLVITPVAAMGGYHQGSSRNLGGVFTFRLAVNFAYQITERARVGIRLGHLSNANVHDKNPGEDEALATFAIGF